MKLINNYFSLININEVFFKFKFIKIEIMIVLSMDFYRNSRVFITYKLCQVKKN